MYTYLHIFLPLFIYIYSAPSPPTLVFVFLLFFIVGDVVLKVKTVPHPTFKRARETLSMKLAIPLRAALLGFETTVTHLDGHTVSICMYLYIRMYIYIAAWDA